MIKRNYCPNCGAKLGRHWQGTCPKCGFTQHVTVPTTAYSRTVTLTGSTVSVYDAIAKAQGMLASAAYNYKAGLPFIEPILKQLETAKDLTRQKEAELVKAQQTNLLDYQKKIDDYRELVKNKVEEPEFQTFFEANPTFLNWQVVKFLPKKSFGGEGFPDLILVLNNKNCIIVELEKPSFRLYNKKGDPTQELSHAEEQIRKYVRWAIEEKEFLRKRGLENLKADNTTGLLVIGSDLSKEERQSLETLNNSVRSMFVVKTFCDILAENEAILKNLQDIGKK